MALPAEDPASAFAWWRRQARRGDLRRLALSQIQDYEALGSR